MIPANKGLREKRACPIVRPAVFVGRGRREQLLDLFDSHYLVVFIFYSFFQDVGAHLRAERHDSRACLVAYFGCIYLIESLKGFLYGSLAVSAHHSLDLY